MISLPNSTKMRKTTWSSNRYELEQTNVQLSRDFTRLVNFIKLWCEVCIPLIEVYIRQVYNMCLKLVKTILAKSFLEKSHFDNIKDAKRTKV